MSYLENHKLEDEANILVIFYPSPTKYLHAWNTTSWGTNVIKWKSKFVKNALEPLVFELR